MCACAFSANEVYPRPEKTVKIDLVISISQQVEDLIKFVESDNIDTRSKTFILSSLYRLQGSLEDIEIGGVREVEESFNTIIGSVIVNNNLNVKPTDSSSAKKFWEIMGRVAIVFTLATGSFAIGKEVVDLISEEQENVEVVQELDKQPIEI